MELTARLHELQGTSNPFAVRQYTGELLSVSYLLAQESSGVKEKVLTTPNEYEDSLITACGDADLDADAAAEDLEDGPAELSPVLSGFQQRLQEQLADCTLQSPSIDSPSPAVFVAVLQQPAPPAASPPQSPLLQAFTWVRKRMSDSVANVCGGLQLLKEAAETGMWMEDDEAGIRTDDDVSSPPPAKKPRANRAGSRSRAAPPPPPVHDLKGRTGWDIVQQLADHLVSLYDSLHIGAADAVQIAELWQGLSDHGDHAAPVLTRAHTAIRREKGSNHQRSKDINNLAAGKVKSHKKIQVSGATCAQSPTVCRVMEATLVRLKAELGPSSSVRELFHAYSGLRELCSKNPTISDSGFLLHSTNQSLIAVWLNHEDRLTELKTSLTTVAGKTAVNPFLSGPFKKISHNDRPAREYIDLTRIFNISRTSAEEAAAFVTFTDQPNMENMAAPPTSSSSARPRAGAAKKKMPLPASSSSSSSSSSGNFPAVIIATPPTQPQHPPQADGTSTAAGATAPLPGPSAGAAPSKPPKKEEFGRLARTVYYKRKREIQTRALSSGLSVDAYSVKHDIVNFTDEICWKKWWKFAAKNT